MKETAVDGSHVDNRLIVEKKVEPLEHAFGNLKGAFAEVSFSTQIGSSSISCIASELGITINTRMCGWPVHPGVAVE